MLLFLFAGQSEIIGKDLTHDWGRGGSPTFPGMFKQTGNRHFRIISRCESNKPGMITILPGEGFALATGSRNHRSMRSCAR